MKTCVPKQRRGFTLVELMVAVTVGTLVMILVLASFSTLSTSMAATGRYREMHHDVRYAMGVLQRDITRGIGVSGFASNRLVLSTTGQGGGGSVSVVYSLSSNVLTRAESGGASEMLASGVDRVTFTLYDASGALISDPADAYFVGVEMALETQGVRNSYSDKLQMRSRMRAKGL
jgi:prepilin-type N-terminal cleavage/methylation domain-containing protein